MDLRNLNLKYVYDSDQDDILGDFYIPALSESVRYRRLAGSFSSSALAVAARGISRLISNGGTMQLVAGAELRTDDVNAIIRGLKEKDQVIADMMTKDLASIEDEFVRDHVKALAWMVANDRLQIKVAIVLGENGVPLDAETVQRRGIFHPKIGILEDDKGNVVTFGGSINESMSGWLYNDEFFWVYPGWIDAFKQITDKNIQKFETCWNGLPNKFIVLDVPTAYKQQLIRIAPATIGELNLEKWYIKTRGPSATSEKIRLRDYQEEAVKNWSANDGRGLFEMATGTGKTWAAIACIKKLREDDHIGKLLVVITCPFTHLVEQWNDNLGKWGFAAKKAFGSSTIWKREIGNEIIDLNDGIQKFLIVITTHDTFSSDPFIEMIQSVDARVFLIADEAHAVGSEIRRQGLIEKYEFRLALTATPRRYFDEEGTDTILNFFGDVVFKLTIRDAIPKYLVPYKFFPHFVEMTEDELEEYKEYSRRLAIKYSMKRESSEEWEKLLAIKRQNIVKNAAKKYDALREIIRNVSKLDHCLIYCTEKQLDVVSEILAKIPIYYHRFTTDETTEERTTLLQRFDRGEYDALVAIKCLDQGVDVPSTRMAIILASTGNPMEFIQRRGRILRKSAGKEFAIIHDIVVIPTMSGEIDEKTFMMEQKILKKEMLRLQELAETSLNPEYTAEKIKPFREMYEL